MSDEARPAAPHRVLVFPGGTEIGLEIAQSLGFRKEVELFSAGADVSSHAPFAFRNHRTLPRVDEAGWLSALQELAAEWSITHIFPAYDDVIVALARAADRLTAKVVTSPLVTCELTRSKRATYERLADVVAVPRVFASPGDVPEFPAFVKPDRGQGSQQAQRVDDRRQLEVACEAIGEPLIMNYLPGEEFTVDCFSDRERGLLFCGPRRRVRMRAGISMNSVSVAMPELRETAERIAARLPLYGAWFFQVKRDADGTLTLLEVAPRIAGASALNRVRGVDFAMLALYEAERIPVEIIALEGEIELDRALRNRYRHSIRFETLYIDLDDTLIVRGEVNVRAAALLHQCHNRGVRVVLLTRHGEGREETLRRHRLGELFDEVVYVAKGTPKSAHVRAGAAVFVDDSFAERRDVREKLGIPTFDSAMLELLLDDRA